MTTVASRAIEQARLLVDASEAGGNHDASGALAASERALRRLADDLTRWFGASGFETLLSRALEQAKLSHAILATARYRGGTEGRLEGFPSSPGIESADEIREAYITLIASTIMLLGRLIGDNLALGLIVRTRIDASTGRPGTTDEETKE